MCVTGWRYTGGMKPLTIRPLTDAERTELHLGLRSPEAFTPRRCQYLLAGAEGRAAAAIAATYGGSQQNVRNVFRAFADRGTACLRPASSANKVPRRGWPRDRDDDLKALLHRPPRDFGRPTGLWTLALLASVCHEKGWTERVLSPETIRQVLVRLEVGWKRAKHWITSPDPDYAEKKKRGTG